MKRDSQLELPVAEGDWIKRCLLVSREEAPEGLETTMITKNINRRTSGGKKRCEGGKKKKE